MPFNCPIDLFGILPKDFASDNSIECSFSLQLKEKNTFSTRIPFELSQVKKPIYFINDNRNILSKRA